MIQAGLRVLIGDLCLVLSRIGGVARQLICLSVCAAEDLIVVFPHHIPGDIDVEIIVLRCGADGGDAGSVVFAAVPGIVLAVVSGIVLVLAIVPGRFLRDGLSVLCKLVLLRPADHHHVVIELCRRGRLDQNGQEQAGCQQQRRISFQVGLHGVPPCF